MHDDLSIVRRLLDGDESLFESVFDGYFPRLYRFALARTNGNADEARDVVQQSLCKAFERLDTYRGEASLYGWMLRICRNTLIDRARRHSAQPPHVSLADPAGALETIAEALRAPDDLQPEKRTARLELLQIIEQTLDYLPSHYGNVLEWKYIEDNSVKEIAEKLEIAPKAAESLLTRARHAFREAILALDESADIVPFGTARNGRGKGYV
ncbi:MAG: sigma-70 family RNA polymerase sigma factor [Gammaproteobacteria bacterium]|jgi:RNA polymerase sigma-70 factor (ECF subfamily)